METQWRVGWTSSQKNCHPTSISSTSISTSILQHTKRFLLMGTSHNNNREQMVLQRIDLNCVTSIFQLFPLLLTFCRICCQAVLLIFSLFSCLSSREDGSGSSPLLRLKLFISLKFVLLKLSLVKGRWIFFCLQGKRNNVLPDVFLVQSFWRIHF